MRAWTIGVVAGLVLVGALAADLQPQEQAGQLMFDPLKGNCFSCHKMILGVFSGNIAPLFRDLQKRFPHRADLYAKIYDPTVLTPLTVMPPFGRNQILSEQEINLIVDYLYTQ
ncbi:L-cysteine S-thiosulfotransferase [Gammaproteobacteria bacterium]